MERRERELGKEEKKRRREEEEQKGNVVVVVVVVVVLSFGISIIRFGGGCDVH